MRSLITGIGGFAGGHLARALIDRGDEVAGIDCRLGAQLAPFAERITLLEGDIRDADAMRGLGAEFRPDTIFHLAAMTHVGAAWKQRRETFEINVIGTSAVLEVAAEIDPKPTVILASTGQVYGPAPADSRPLSENTASDPRSPYAASKVCCEVLARQAWKSEHVPTVILRTFNYTGPWQAPSFVCADFARQVAWIEAGFAEPLMKVGNLRTHRDFSDVRDIIDGYLLAADHGVAGEAYNLASGSTVEIAEVLDRLRAEVDVDIEVRQDADRVRPADLAALVGDATRAREELGWKPRFDFEDTLASVLDFWRQQAAKER